MNVLITQLQLEQRLSVLLQLHLHSRLNTWLQWNGQRQLQDETRRETLKCWDLVWLILGVWRYNPLNPAFVSIHRCIGSSLVRIMAYRLLGATSLPELMLTPYQLDHRKHNSVKYYTKYNNFNSWKHNQNVVCKISAILFQPQSICPPSGPKGGSKYQLSSLLQKQVNLTENRSHE